MPMQLNCSWIIYNPVDNSSSPVLVLLPQLPSWLEDSTFKNKSSVCTKLVTLVVPGANSNTFLFDFELSSGEGYHGKGKCHRPWIHGDSYDLWETPTQIEQVLVTTQHVHW